jgi:glycosyltransferase involved in cell wall biosynthesis
MAEELPRATIVAVPSRWESFGYVAAEAAAAGRAIVASLLPGLAEVVEDGVTGILTPAEDPVALGRALAELLRHPATARSMGQAGAARMAARNHPDQVAAETLDAYQFAAAKFRGAGALEGARQ